MSRKRRNTSSPELDYSPPPKKSRSMVSYDDEDEEFDHPQDSKEQPRLNPTSGLQNVFPGLGEDGDELFYGPAADGLEYLRMVRSEAKGVPNLLLANLSSASKHSSGTASDDIEEGLIYFDGTYTAPTRRQQIRHTTSDCQQEYHDSLLDRFQWLREVLGSSPPLEAIQTLDPSRPITCPPDSKVARDAWEQHILTHDPHAAQVASIDWDSVLEIINTVTRRLGKLLRDSSNPLISRLGSWIWALLARCPDRGELGSEEIAELRAFAAKAVDLTRAIEGTQTVSIGDEDETEVVNGDGPHGSEDPVPQALATGVKSGGQSMKGPGLENRMVEDMTSKPAVVILDAIITIVGEFYGQRDLLEHRMAWTKRQKASLDVPEMNMVVLKG